MADKPCAEAELGAFRDGLLAGGDGNAVGALDLVEQVGELGARPLEARRVDVGDVVGDDFDIGLLGRHAGRCDR